MAAMLEAADGQEAIRRFAEGNSAIAARVRAHDEQLRRDGYTRIIGYLAGRFGLPAGLDPADAVDIVLTLAGPATYRSLVADYGCPHDRFDDWLAVTLSQQLLPASRAAPS